VNNVLYNWMSRSVDGGDEQSFFTFINNYYKPGPMTPAGSPVSHRILKPEAQRGKPATDKFGRAYVAGNIVEGNARVTADNWDGGVQIEPVIPGADRNALLATIRADKPWPHAPLDIQPAAVAFESVLAHAGATLPRRDAVDERIVAMTRAGTATHRDGRIRLPSDVGGYPEYRGTPHADADRDGLPDAWERRHRLNPADPTDATGDLNGDGYANIEDYINGLDPAAPKTDWSDLRNNVDRRHVVAR